MIFQDQRRQKGVSKVPAVIARCQSKWETECESRDGGNRDVQLFSPSSGRVEDSLPYRNLAACRMDRTARPVHQGIHRQQSLSLPIIHVCREDTADRVQAYTCSVRGNSNALRRKDPCGNSLPCRPESAVQNACISEASMLCHMQGSKVSCCVQLVRCTTRHTSAHSRLVCWLMCTKPAIPPTYTRPDGLYCQAIVTGMSDQLNEAAPIAIPHSLSNLAFPSCTSAARHGASLTTGLL